MFAAWQGTEIHSRKDEVWEALEFPGYRTVWTETEWPGPILLPLTPNCVPLARRLVPLGLCFPSHYRGEGNNVDEETGVGCL